MPAHLRATLTGVTLAIPVIGGRPALGTWQGIYLAEHRRAPHRREVAIHLVGE
jgi:secondary thiamine-phosphate synthase enzyme